LVGRQQEGEDERYRVREKREVGKSTSGSEGRDLIPDVGKRTREREKERER
jgi:hypothetical protein